MGLFGLVAAAPAQVSNSLSVETPAATPQPGDKLAARLTVTIAPGWHISSLTQPDGGLVRTEIALSPNQPFKLTGDIIAPKPHVEHSAAFDMNVETYTGTVIFTLPLVATEDIKPGTKLTVEVTYQACSEENCLLPTTEKVSCIVGSTTKNSPPMP